MNGYDYKPLVSINILSFNRREELKNTLQKVYEQNYKNIEVIVVDNASTDGSPEMVEYEFPDVILIKLTENIGIAGWNKGFEIAKGEYVLVLDDDAYPAEGAIALGVDEILKDNTIACIAFNISDLNSRNKIRTKWLPSQEVIKCEWPVFVGCAALFHKKMLSRQPMPEDYFVYQHELPISATIYSQGGKIIYLKDAIAYHFFKDQFSYSKKLDQYVLRNNLKYIFAYLPLFISPFYFLQNILFFFTRSIRRKWLKDYFIIIKDLGLKSNNEKISLSYFFYLRKLHLFNLGLLSKLRIK